MDLVRAGFDRGIDNRPSIPAKDDIIRMGLDFEFGDRIHGGLRHLSALALQVFLVRVVVDPPSITVYPIKASGDTPPLRTIQGPQTRLNWPAHMYVDDARGEIYVANDGDDSILVFRVTDGGNVAPTRVLKGPKTQIKNPTDVFVDTINDEMVVANMGNHRATVYRRTAQGDTPPIRTIRAAADGVPALQIANPGSVAYDSKREEIIVPN